MKIRGKRVLVTGAGSGIGRLFALGAGQRGAKRVVIWDLDSDAGEAVAAEVRKLGVDAEFQRVSVADRQAVADAAASAGQIDILVNNVGVVSGKPFLQLTPEAIERTFDVNVLSLYWVTQAFLPGMLERDEGMVVTIASAAALVGVARQTDYSASKFAAFGFTESLRAELRKQQSHVKTLVVCPYYIDTGMFDGVKTRFSLLLPILKPTYVQRRVLNAIESGREQLIMPRFARLTPVLRILPPRAFDSVVGLLGINSGMDDFRGRG